LTITTGSTGAGSTGNLNLLTGGAQGSGQILIRTGNSEAGAGYSDITLQAGQKPLGSLGSGDIRMILGTSGKGITLSGTVTTNRITLNPGTDGAYVNGNLNVGANTVSAGLYLHSSDERLKQDITPLSNALDKVKAMNGVSFKFKADPSRVHIGLIAQNVEKTVPEVVTTGTDGMKSVEYANLVAVLIEAVKEQQVIIDGLRNDVAELKAHKAAQP